MHKMASWDDHSITNIYDEINVDVTFLRHVTTLRQTECVLSQAQRNKAPWKISIFLWSKLFSPKVCIIALLKVVYTLTINVVHVDVQKIFIAYMG